MKFIREHPQWNMQTANAYGNPISTFLGLAAGYAYYVNSKTNFIEKYVSIFSKSVISVNVKRIKWNSI